ncbi:hypothetical protein ACIBFB_13710 [Nocardiopsis sp. NPDC050513]|uniref:hypothetical protein n=1 Tax=Nocardiopsis sp. NPDC050513 TaxID=3364338 RepID=UPI0037982292
MAVMSTCYIRSDKGLGGLSAEIAVALRADFFSTSVSSSFLRSTLTPDTGVSVIIELTDFAETGEPGICEGTVYEDYQYDVSIQVTGPGRSSPVQELETLMIFLDRVRTVGEHMVLVDPRERIIAFVDRDGRVNELAPRPSIHDEESNASIRTALAAAPGTHGHTADSDGFCVVLCTPESLYIAGNRPGASTPLLVGAVSLHPTSELLIGETSLAILGLSDGSYDIDEPKAMPSPEQWPSVSALDKPECIRLIALKNSNHYVSVRSSQLENNRLSAALTELDWTDEGTFPNPASDVLGQEILRLAMRDDT